MKGKELLLLQERMIVGDFGMIFTYTDALVWFRKTKYKIYFRIPCLK